MMQADIRPSIEIRTITYNDNFTNKPWDHFVENHPEGSFFHLSGWGRVLEASFGHKCHSIYAWEDEKIIGVLPLFEVKSLLFSHALISSPLCVYGGAIADQEEVSRLLEEKAIQIAEQLQVEYLELRYKKKQNSALSCISKHATFIHALPATDDDILLSIKKKQRAVIRHSLKNDLQYKSASLSLFYQLLSESYKSLGTPVFAKKYFQNIQSVFSDKVTIKQVQSEQGEDLCAVLSFTFKNQVLPYYAGGNDNAKYLKSMDYMYYQLMCEARKQGLSEFDFGRSKNDSGPFKYKKNWGMTAQPLYHYYHLVKANKIPDLSPNNPKYHMFISLWKRLPLKVSQLIGPFIAKGLG